MFLIKLKVGLFIHKISYAPRGDLMGAAQLAERTHTINKKRT